MPRTIIPIREYPDDLPCDSEPHGADHGWFRHDEPMDGYSEREIERSQAMIAALFGPEEMARLNEGFFDEYDDQPDAAANPDLRRPLRLSPRPRTARRPLSITYWIAIGFFLSIGIILGFLWLYVSSLEATALPGAPSSPHPAALIRSAVA